LRTLLGRKPKLDFDEEFGDEDRLTQAVTLFALLELHKKGEASWNQKEPFGPIEVVSR
jgi:segregation and condensation protein A